MHAQTGRHQTAYGQVRESWWQACLTGEEEDGGRWRGQRWREWQGQEEGKGQAVTHERGGGACGWQTAAGGDDQLTWHIGSYHRRALGQTEGGTRGRAGVRRAASLPKRQTSVEGRLRNTRRQARWRHETETGVRRRRVKVLVPPRGTCVCLSPNHFFFFFRQIFVKCWDDPDSLTLGLLWCREPLGKTPTNVGQTELIYRAALRWLELSSSSALWWWWEWDSSSRKSPQVLWEDTRFGWCNPAAKSQSVRRDDWTNWIFPNYSHPRPTPNVEGYRLNLKKNCWDQGWLCILELSWRFNEPLPAFRNERVKVCDGTCTITQWCKKTANLFHPDVYIYIYIYKSLIIVIIKWPQINNTQHCWVECGPSGWAGSTHLPTHLLSSQN